MAVQSNVYYVDIVALLDGVDGCGGCMYFIGLNVFSVVVLTCDCLHVCTVCIWRCEHGRFLCGSSMRHKNLKNHSFTHSLV